MVKFGKKVVKFRIPIIIISILLLIPAALGYINTRVNYDVEYYGAAEPPVRCGESHLSGLTEPPHFVY